MLAPTRELVQQLNVRARAARLAETSAHDETAAPGRLRTHRSATSSSADATTADSA